MGAEEVVLNLWYVHDDEGIIYSLRAKAYVVRGTDEGKLAFLQERAGLDYLIAQPFEIPERFHVQVGVGSSAKVLPVGHVSLLKMLDTPIALFEDAIGVLEAQFPAQSDLSIPEDPLVCTTPLMSDSRGVIKPKYEGQSRYDS